jgi:carboxyl-terminal processing protease
MMRKLSYLVLGAAIGAGASTLLTQGLLYNGSAVAAASDTYKKLNLFGDIFERSGPIMSSPPMNQN